MEKFDDYLDKAKDLAKSAKEQTSAYSLGAKEKVQGILNDAKAGKEIQTAIDELDAMKDFEGSIIYKMELETMINSLNSLLLVVQDKRLDDGSVVEEIKEFMEKVQPSEQPAEAPAVEGSADETAAEDSAVGSTADDSASGSTAVDTAAGTSAGLTDEQQMIEKAKAVSYNACSKALALIENPGV